MHPATLKTQFGIADFVIKKLLGDLTHEQSMVQPTREGNCLNWVMGHLTDARNEVIAVLGGKPPFPKDRFARYKTGQPPLTDSSEALPFEEIMADFSALQEHMTSGLDRIPPEKLAEKAPFSPTDNPDETIGSLLAGFAFHEAYHIGQAGLLRRIAGKPNPLG